LGDDIVLVCTRIIAFGFAVVARPLFALGLLLESGFDRDAESPHVNGVGEFHEEVQISPER
jgi:hypothetical protein